MDGINATLTLPSQKFLNGDTYDEDEIHGSNTKYQVNLDQIISRRNGSDGR